MFTFLWTGWMLWSSGSFDRPHVIMMAICGAAAGYAWYHAMRWQFRRSGMFPRSEHTTESAEKR
jgi:hypothetical protein